MTAGAQLPNLTPVIALNGTELFELVQSGSTYRANLSQMAAYIAAGIVGPGFQPVIAAAAGKVLTGPASTGGPPGTLNVGGANGVVVADSSGNISAQTTLAAGGSSALSFSARFAQRVNVRDFGAVGNALTVTDTVTCVNGNTSITFGTTTFAAATVGDVILLPGLGAGSAPLSATITAATGTSTISVNTAPSVTMTASSVTFTYGSALDSTGFFNAKNTNKPVYIPAGNYIINSSGFHSITQTLILDPGAVLTIAPGVTLNLHAFLQAGRYQVFNLVGTGNVTFFSQPSDFVYPEWWGAVPSSVGDSTQAFVGMLGCGAQSARLDNSTYLISATLTMPGNFLLRGSQFLSTVQMNDATGLLDTFVCTNTGNMTFDGVAFARSQTATAGSAVHLINSFNNKIINCTFNSQNYNGVYLGNNGGTGANQNVIFSNRISVAGSGIVIDSTNGSVSDTIVQSNYIHTCPVAGVSILGAGTSSYIMDNVIFNNGYGINCATGFTGKIRQNDIDSNTNGSLITGGSEFMLSNNWLGQGTASSSTQVLNLVNCVNGQISDNIVDVTVAAAFGIVMSGCSAINLPGNHFNQGGDTASFAVGLTLNGATACSDINITGSLWAPKFAELFLSLTGAGHSFINIDILASSSGVVGGTGSATNMAVFNRAKGYSQPFVATFATLPSGSPAGAEATISDAGTVTYRANAAGGGSNVARVLYTGAAWVYN